MPSAPTQKRLRAGVLFRILGFLVLLLHARAPGAITLANARVSLTFDANYSLMEISEDFVGFKIEQASGGAPIWNLTLLHASATPGNALHWINDFTRINAHSAGINAHAGHSLTVVPGGQQLDITWSAMPVPDGSANDLIDLVLGVFLPNDSAEAAFSLDVQVSGSGYSLWRADAPILLLPESGTGLPTLNRAALPRKGGALVHDPADPIHGILMPLNQDETLDGSPTGSHPRDYELQYMHLYDAGSTHGLLVRTTDSEGYFKGLILHRHNSGQLYILPRHYPEEVTTAGLGYSLPYQLQIQPFVGDWFDGARFYREFFLSLPSASKGPIADRSDFAHDLAETMHLTHIADLNSGGNYPNALDLEASLEAWRDFFAPIQLSVHLRGMGPGNPDPDVVDPAGVAALDIASKLEIRSIPYTSSYAWLNTSLDDANFTRHNASIKNYSGSAQQGMFSDIRMDPSVADWRDKFNLRTQTMLNKGATDQYIDLNINFHFCFDTSHGHPLGSGRHFMNGYRTQMIETRATGKASHPSFSMLPEHRSELTVDLFDFYRLPYWAGDGDSLFVGGTEKTLPAPLIATVMHDYIGLSGSAGRESTYAQLGEETYRFVHAYSFVQGSGLTMADVGQNLDDFDSDKAATFAFLRDLLYHRSVATDTLLYGEMLRPPDTGSTLRTITIHGQGYSQPAILGSAFAADDGSVGFTLVNDASISEYGELRLHLADYGMKGLDQGTWAIYSTTPQLGAGTLSAQSEFYGGFREEDYTRLWRFEASEILLLQARAVVDQDGDGMGDSWETEHGLNPSYPGDAQLDPDGDGLANLAEFQFGCNPALADSDQDGDQDALEVALGSDPRDPTSGIEGPPGLPLLRGGASFLLLSLILMSSPFFIRRLQLPNA